MEFADWNPGAREESRGGTWSKGGAAGGTARMQGGRKTT